MCIDDNSVRLAGPLRLCAPLRLCVEKTQMRDAKTCISRRTDFLEIGVRLDFHHFHADAGLRDVRCARTVLEQCATLRGTAFDRTRAPEHQVPGSSDARGAFEG